MNKLNKNQNGFMLTLIFMVIVVIIAAGLVGYLYYKKHTSGGKCPPGKIAANVVSAKGATKTLACVLPPLNVNP